MRRLVPLLLVPLAACSPSSDPAADSVGKAERASHGGTEVGGRTLLPPDPKAPLLSFSAAAADVVFEPDAATVETGVVNIRFRTDGAHNWTLGGPRLLVWGQESGAPVDVTHAVRLEPGTYPFYCSVPGHEQAGMKGTLTVR